MIPGRIVPHVTRALVPGRGVGVVVKVDNARRFLRGFGHRGDAPARAHVELDTGGRAIVPVGMLELERELPDEYRDELATLRRLERLRELAVADGLGGEGLDRYVEQARARVDELERELAGEVPAR